MSTEPVSAGGLFLFHEIQIRIFTPQGFDPEADTSKPYEPLLEALEGDSELAVDLIKNLVNQHIAAGELPEGTEVIGDF